MAYPQSFGLEQVRCTTQALASSVSFVACGVSFNPAAIPMVRALVILLETLFRGHDRGDRFVFSKATYCPPTAAMAAVGYGILS